MKEPFLLKHTALYAKHWYFRSENIWEDLTKTLYADDYISECKDDTLRCLIRNYVKIIPEEKSKSDIIYSLISGILPSDCWKCGYYTKEHNWFKNSNFTNIYDTREAVVRFILSEISLMDVVDLGGLPKPDKKILPLRKDVEKQLEKEAKKSKITIFNFQF
jgi:hypothetical protein